ncbi:MAG TPA: alpha/beta fold hydrolase [Anaeromyxobacteraceae bacterium]|nr:alpha/beta fold hydrolase [Anaeromyxobacteraceae bacterium]
MALVETREGPRLHHEDLGRGPPAVLVHGWSSSSGVFAEVAAALAGERRVIAPDLRGHGRSGGDGTFGIPDLAGDLALLLERLDLEGALLLGWSMGAQVALEALPAVAPRLAALALVSGTPRFVAGEGWPHGQPARTVEALAHRLRRDPARAVARFFDDMFVPGELADPDRARLDALRRALPPPHPASALAGLDALARGDQRPRLAAVRVPLLVLHGEADPICPASAARAVAASVAGSRLALWPGVGHAPFLSRPGPFLDLLRGFLEGIG